MKKPVLIIILLMAMALVLPAANFLIDAKQKTPRADGLQGSEIYKESAGILEKKCSHCHGQPDNIPFYANLPGIEKMVAKDISKGRSWFGLYEILEPEDGKISEVALAKLEDAIVHGKMPVHRYAMMHWRNMLTRSEKETILQWIAIERALNYASGEAAVSFQNEVVQPLPREVKVDKNKAALGEKLFHDKRLSGDETLSCASCHALDKGGTDQSQFSTGINGAVGPINAPTVFNAGPQIKQFWDGRAADLKEQAAGPVHNPIEMGSDWKQVIPRLEKDLEFKKEFMAVFPRGISGDAITEAIAEFEKTLVTPDSRFDQYLRGNVGAITPEEKEGYELFKANACTTCHAGQLLGGQSFEKLGREADYFEARGGEVADVDQGRFNVTGSESDRHKFKVPTLRNVELTFPYFHDGSAETLGEAVQTMAMVQNGDALSQAEVDKIVQFLKTLTGQYRGKSLA